MSVEMSSHMSADMSTEIVTAAPAARPLIRARSFVFGPPLPSRLPERVQGAILDEQETSEILVTLLQMLAIVTFAILYTLTPKAFPPNVPFEPVPVALAVYAAFTLVRLWLAWRRRLRPWFLALSVIVDITMLMVTIWSFYLQYEKPPAIYLKAPTLMYAFILIALRTLRFEPWLVMLAGVSAAAGWLCLVAYAVIAEGGAEITHSFATYATSYQILLGAEFDKVVSLLMVTLILAIGLLRARKLLFRAVADQHAAAELSRFFAPEVAGRIRRQRHRARARPGGAARGRDPDGRSARLHAADPPPGAKRGHAAALRVPVAGGARRSRRAPAASTSSWATAFSRASARPVRAPVSRPTRCARSTTCSRRPRPGPRSAGQLACPRHGSGPRSRPDRSCSARSAIAPGSSTRSSATR